LQAQERTHHKDMNVTPLPDCDDSDRSERSQKMREKKLDVAQVSFDVDLDKIKSKET